MAHHSTCPFCHIEDSQIIYQNDYGVIIHDANPLSKGHSLIITHRHVTSFFDVTDKERKALISLLEQTRNHLNMLHQPDGFHIGFNDGNVVDGQIEHLHIHVIPRYRHTPMQLDPRWGILMNDQPPPAAN